MLTEWTNVGSYRRALGNYQVKLHANPLLKFTGSAFNGGGVPLGAAFPDHTDKTALGFFGPNLSIVPTNGQYIAISADATKISRSAGKVATVTLQRAGVSDVSLPVTVSYKVSGVPVAGRDYQTLPGVKTIKAGRQSATLKIVTLPGGSNGALTITVKPTVDYSTPLPGSIIVKITN